MPFFSAALVPCWKVIYGRGAFEKIVKLCPKPINNTSTQQSEQCWCLVAGVLDGERWSSKCQQC